MNDDIPQVDNNFINNNLICKEIKFSQVKLRNLVTDMLDDQTMLDEPVSAAWLTRNKLYWRFIVANRKLKKISSSYTLLSPFTDLHDESFSESIRHSPLTSLNERSSIYRGSKLLLYTLIAIELM